MNREAKTQQVIGKRFEQSGKELSSRIANSFNYPAFIFPVIYNLAYKRWKLALISIVLTWLPHCLDHYISSTVYFYLVDITALIIIALAAYSGFTGNVAAFNARKYDDEKDFIRSQKFWIPFAVLGIIFHIIIYPVQKTGHINTINMIRLAEAKQELKIAIQDGLRSSEILGVSAVGHEKVVDFFKRHLTKGVYDQDSTITMPNGVTYFIEGFEQECGTRAENTYHEKKTACARITVDLNGKSEPNEYTTLDDLKEVSSLLNRKTRLKDLYTLYAYNDDVAPKEGSVEQFALERFER